MNIIIYVKYEHVPLVEKIYNGDTSEDEKMIDFRLSETKLIDGNSYVQCVVNFDTLKILTEINELKKF